MEVATNFTQPRRDLALLFSCSKLGFLFSAEKGLGDFSSESDTMRAFSESGRLQRASHHATKSKLVSYYYDNTNLRRLKATMAQGIIFSRYFHFFVFQVVAGIYHNTPTRARSKRPTAFECRQFARHYKQSIPRPSLSPLRN